MASAFRCLITIIFTAVAIDWCCTAAAADPSFRPPAVPLVACDPYFSIWSEADQLTDVETTHWTGKPHRLSSLIRIDGQCYRIMGTTPSDVPALKQSSVSVLPTRSVYQFAGGGVELTLTFLTPALPWDLRVLSRPTTYLTYDVRATDGNSHDVEIYLDAAGEVATNTPDQEVQGDRIAEPSFAAVKIGSVSQRVLRKAGDDIRIDWGHLYVAAPANEEPVLALAERDALQNDFASRGTGSLSDAVVDETRPAGEMAGAVAVDVGPVTDAGTSAWFLLAYDDLYSVQFMKHNLRPYWRKDGWDARDLLQAAVTDYVPLAEQCAAFDQELMEDLRRVGGDQYAAIASLAYRQCFAAGKFVADANGQPLQFSKENHSNGCMATADVFYPMAPQFLLFGPTLTKSFLVPFMEYAASDRWRFPFAPHDLGTYPHANGQRYGGGEESAENQMPVEESGNLLLLFAALAKMEGNADFASQYWEQLEQWAQYLADKGFDPENQLCTDDFAGHLAHNVNLSAKAICALGAYANLCELRGDDAQAAEYRQRAKKFAQQWVQNADDGDHYRLAFDRSGTWSQKYNLVWDRILDLGLFPEEVLETEMAFYRKVQNEYGLPLDNRSDYTKLDWILWTATLTGDGEDFSALVSPVYKFLNETPDRSPMTDWYYTSTARKRGFTARPVVGGVFLRMLYEDSLWQKYASRDRTRSSGWARMPTPPETKTLVATSEQDAAQWRYTTQRPRGNWTAAVYDDSSWTTAPGGFGTPDTPGTAVRTRWASDSIWIRRTFELSGPLPEKVAVRLHHDEDVQVYINGQLVLDLEGYTTNYESEEIPATVLRKGENVIAVHCRQSTGGQYIDVGLDAIVPAEE